VGTASKGKQKGGHRGGGEVRRLVLAHLFGRSGTGCCVSTFKHKSPHLVTKVSASSKEKGNRIVDVAERQNPPTANP